MKWLKRLFYFFKRWYYGVPNIMQVDIAFAIAKVYNIDKKVDVVQGQMFTISTDLEGPAKWFSDNDPVLNINQQGNNASVTAAELGTSTILIVGTDYGVIKEIQITVVDGVSQAAVALNATSGQPIEK